MADTIVTAVHKGANAVAGLPDTLTAVQDGRAQHVVALAGLQSPRLSFVDNGYIVLDLDDETELGSGRVQELPDGVESVLRRAMAQGIGVTILDEHETARRARQHRCVDAILNRRQKPILVSLRPRSIPMKRGNCSSSTRMARPAC